MMKKITFILLVFLSVISLGYTQVQVGTGSNIQQRLPFNASFGYSYTQSIYLASEINASGTITSIQWYYNGNGDLNFNQALVIYFGNTTKTQFDSTADWIPVGNLTSVYTGAIITDSTPGWKTLTLDTPFVYDGTSNLVVAVDENTEGWDSYSDRFFNSEVSTSRSLAVWLDYDNIDPASPPEAYNMISYVPNIIFGGISQACPTPIYVTATNVTTSTAKISWQAPTTSPAGGSEYYLSTSNVDPTSTTTPTGAIASGETFNLSTLTPETQYYVWVRNNCGGNVFSAWSAVSPFITDCIAVADFYENFTDVTVPNLPSCWNKILRDGAVVSPEMSVVTNAWFGNTAPLVAMDTSTGNSQDAETILVSPNLSTLSLGTYRMKFLASGNGVIKIGTLSSNDNTAVFTEVGSGINLTNVFTEYVIDFSSYTGPDKYIGIVLVVNINNQFGTSAYIDNILWEPSPSCPDVSEISVPGVTTSSATVVWTPGTGASTTTSWDVSVGASTETDPNNGQIVNVTNPTASLTGLTDNTTYNLWVRSVCGASENGVWIGPISFTTACLPIANFYQNFNNAVTPNLPSCWSKIIRGADVSQFSWVETTQYSDILPQPNIAASLYNDSSGPMSDIILVSPSLSTLGLGTYRLKFVAKHGFTPAAVQVGTLNTNTAAADFTVVQAVALTENSTQYVVEFNTYSGTDTYIGIRLVASEQYSSVFLDNILWELSPSCPDVTQIQVPSTTPNTVTVTWIAGGSEVSWDVAVGLVTEEDPNALPFTSTTVPIATVSGLMDNTTYNVWVRSVCTGNDNGAWIGPVSFTTACLAVATFSEDFQNVIIPELPACWSKILSGSQLSEFASIRTSEYSNLPLQTNAVVLQNNDSGTDSNVILVSPNVSTLNLGSYRLKFIAKGSSGSQSIDPGFLEVGTLNGNTSLAQFNVVGNVNTTNNPTEYVVDFDSYTGTDTYIGIRLNSSTQYQYIEIDNIVWEPIPLCPDVNQLMVVETTTTTGTVSWNGGTASQWQIAVGQSTDIDPNVLTPVSTVNTSELLPNLTAGTTYNVWVRAVCGAPNGNGTWEGPIALITQCNSSAVPYIQDFETAILPNMPTCTSAYNLSQGPYNWYVSNNPGYGFESNTLTYNSDLYTDANAWFYTTGITLTAGQEYTISYRYGGASTDTFFYNNNLKVMYGSEANESAMTTLIANYVDFAVDAPVSQSINFSPETSGVYYFGFDVYSPNNSSYMFIDDIAIDVALANNTFDKSKISYHPNPVKDILTITNDNNITSVKVYNILGQEVITKTINNNITKIDMSSLAKGAYLVKIATENAQKTIKVIKE